MSGSRTSDQEPGVNAVDFYDNNFFTREARVAEFAERIPQAFARALGGEPLIPVRRGDPPPDEWQR